MKKEFQNKDHVKIFFTDEGVTFCGDTQEVYFPYGCIDEMNLSLLGILQITHRSKVCTFAVDRKDRADIKEMIKFAKEAKKTAPDEDVRIIDLGQPKAGDGQDGGLSVEEQLKKYKTQFIQGMISKEEYDARKRQLKGK